GHNIVGVTSPVVLARRARRRERTSPSPSSVRTLRCSTTIRRTAVRATRLHSSVTSLSWIPSEAVTGLNKAIFGTGFTHYDAPPPDRIGRLDALRSGYAFRFANHLAAWVDVADGQIVDAGYDGGSVMGSTTVGLAGKQATFAGVSFDDIRRPVENKRTSAPFSQSGGRR